MAPSTTITGLASGIEWKDTVDQLMVLESQPMEKLIDRKSESKSKQDAWNAIEELIKTLQSESQSIDSRTELIKKTASSSDNDLVTVSANANAVSSTHSIFVNQLAQAETEVHDGFPDINTTAVHTGAGGVFAYTYGTESAQVNVGSGTTIAGLVQLINNDADNPGVIASTIDDGSGGATSIHLVLMGAETGADNTITINDGATNLNGGGFTSASWTETQSAQDAEIQVDGYPTAPPPYITRDSNTIDDVINGLTFTLKDTTTSAIQVNVEEDLSTIKQKITDWVDDYNEIMKTMAAYTRYDSENEIQGLLMGDSRIYTVRGHLQELVIGEIPGLPADNSYSNLASIGLKTGTGGMLTVDSTKLQEALEDDLDSVANLFIFTHSSNSENLSYFARTNATEGGEYAVHAEYLANGKLDPNGNNTIGGYAAKVKSNYYLVGKDDTPVEGLRIYFKSPGGGAGSVDGTIRIGTGAAVMADNEVDDLTDSVEGLFKVIDDSYNDQIESFDDQIDNWERRLEIRRETLERQYLAMENAVSEAKNQSSWMSSI